MPTGFLEHAAFQGHLKDVRAEEARRIEKIEQNKFGIQAQIAREMKSGVHGWALVRKWFWMKVGAGFWVKDVKQRKAEREKREREEAERKRLEALE
jgi:hypothetical protein